MDKSYKYKSIQTLVNIGCHQLTEPHTWALCTFMCLVTDTHYKGGIWGCGEGLGMTR
jgi:hypothetical protein